MHDSSPYDSPSYHRLHIILCEFLGVPQSPSCLRSLQGLGKNPRQLILDSRSDMDMDMESVADNEGTINEDTCPDLFAVPDVMSPTPIKAARLHSDSDSSSSAGPTQGDTTTNWDQMTRLMTNWGQEIRPLPLSRERATAALRALAHGKDGAYLFRQDDRSQPTFITYLYGATIHHCAVSERNGQLYVGIRPFESLEAIAQHYAGPASAHENVFRCLLTEHCDVDQSAWATGNVQRFAYDDLEDLRCAELLDEIECTMDMDTTGGFDGPRVDGKILRFGGSRIDDQDGEQHAEDEV